MRKFDRARVAKSAHEANLHRHRTTLQELLTRNRRSRKTNSRDGLPDEEIDVEDAGVEHDDEVEHARAAIADSKQALLRAVEDEIR